MTTTEFAVGQTVTEIPLPAVREVIVLNSSGGIGDGSGPDVVVNAGQPAALTPEQVGMRLKCGQLAAVPLQASGTGQPLALYAIADGPGAQVTLEILEGPT